MQASVASAEVDRVGRSVVTEVREGCALGHPDPYVMEAGQQSVAMLRAVHPRRDNPLGGAPATRTPCQVLSDRPNRRAGQIPGVPNPGGGVAVRVGVVLGHCDGVALCRGVEVGALL